MARRKKGGTPAWIDRLLSFRKEITEDEYRDYWKRINRLRRNQDAWNKEGERIIRELESAPDGAPLFHSRFYASSEEAYRAAQVYQEEHGGRIVRRDAKGRISKRGTTFQVIGGDE